MPDSNPDSTIHADQEMRAVRKFVFGAFGLTILFSVPLYQVVRVALESELYSFVILVPAISGYLLWMDRPRFFPAGNRLSPIWAFLFGFCGIALLVWTLIRQFSSGPSITALALSVYAYVLMLLSLALLTLGRDTLRSFAFPLFFLFFLAPFPPVVENGLETVLQYGSSFAAHQIFNLSGMPVYREGTYFQLPGFSLQVAPECSGIRSTLALFLTSLVAGQLFLRSPWKRFTLAFVVLPVALVRNGFRVFVIGELCVRVGPHMIDSWIHRHGGPVFFALSLLPFGLILYWLYKIDQSRPVVSNHS